MISIDQNATDLLENILVGVTAEQRNHLQFVFTLKRQLKKKWALQWESKAGGGTNTMQIINLHSIWQ